MYEEAALLAQEMRLDFQEQQKDRKMPKKNDQYFISDEFSKYLDNNEPETDFIAMMNHEAKTAGIFCVEDNLSACIKSINESLSMFGFQSGIVLPSSEAKDAATCINIVYSLLQHIQDENNSKETLSDKNRRLQMDKDQLYSQKLRLEERIMNTEREVAALKAKEKALQESHKHIKEKLENEKDELTKRLNAFQQKDTQHQHELRKKEREYEKLREKLQQIANDKLKESSKVGVDITTNGKKKPIASQSTGSLGSTMTASKSDELHKLVVNGYENKITELRMENQDLRVSLQNLQDELNGLIKSQKTQPSTPTVSQVPQFEMEDEDLDSISEAQFKLPFHMVKGSIEDSLRHRMAILKHQIQRISSGGSDSESLQTRLSECINIVREQHQLLLLSINAQPAKRGSMELNDSSVEFNKRCLEEERAMFESQRKNFVEERQRLTDGLIKLSEERLQFEKEKRDFSDQYNRWQSQVQNDSFWKAVATPMKVQQAQISHTPNDRLAAFASPSFNRIMGSSATSPGIGISPISGRRTWTLPADTESFINNIASKHRALNLDASDSDDEKENKDVNPAKSSS